MVALNNVATTTVAILAGARTPFVKMGGALAGVHAADLARVAMTEALYRSHWPVDRLDEVLMGNVVMPVDATNLARVAAIYAGIPAAVPALTLQRNCASGMEAIADAASRIRSGSRHAVLAGGVESMSSIPLLFPADTTEPMTHLAKAKTLWQRTTAAASLRPHHFKPIAALERGLTDPTNNMIMGKTAEVLAQEFGISRQEQDQYAMRSHQRAVAAAAGGRFADEIVPVYAGKNFQPITADIGPRENQTLQALAKMKPIFDKRDGTVTIGNSCQVTDGAVAVLTVDEESVAGQPMDPLGYVRDYAVAALDPAHMGLGPVYAIDKLLRSSGRSLGDIELFEINEAFAAQVLACLKAMASKEYCTTHLNRSNAIGEIDPDKLNVNGGAIALGHPVGASAARIVLTLLNEMKRRNLHLGLAALCVGGGQGAAMLLERR